MDGRLRIQRLFQRPYRKITCDISVRNAGNYAPVMKVNDTAVIPHIVILQKQTRKIGTPFLIDCICGKILFQPIFKYFVLLSLFILWLFRSGNGTKSQFCIHIFMDGRGTIAVTLSCQIDCHSSIPVKAVMFVVDFFNLGQNL